MAQIQKDIEKGILVSDLAELTGLSESQFRKRFKEQFRLSPQEFILRAKLQRAARLLSTTNLALSSIAQKAGFCDQSYFTKQFRVFFGIPPKRYRQMWRATLRG